MTRLHPMVLQYLWLEHLSCKNGEHACCASYESKLIIGPSKEAGGKILQSLQLLVPNSLLNIVVINRIQQVAQNIRHINNADQNSLRRPFPQQQKGERYIIFISVTSMIVYMEKIRGHRNANVNVKAVDALSLDQVPPQTTETGRREIAFGWHSVGSLVQISRSETLLTPKQLMLQNAASLLIPHFLSLIIKPEALLTAFRLCIIIYFSYVSNLLKLLLKDTNINRRCNSKITIQMLAATFSDPSRKWATTYRVSSSNGHPLIEQNFHRPEISLTSMRIRNI